MISELISIIKSESSEKESSGEDDIIEEMHTQSGLPDEKRQHQDVVAPSIYIEESDKARVGKDYIQTIFMSGWPDSPDSLYLQRILYDLNVRTELSIHVKPRPKEVAIKKLDNEMQQARSRMGASISTSSQKARKKRFEDTKQMYDAVNDTDAELHEVGMYMTVRAEDEEELRLSVERIVRELRKLSIEPEIPRHNQKDCIQSVSPDGLDKMKYKHPMLSGAVGRMYPFSTTDIIEENGIDFGEHAGNGSPVIIDRFSRQNGYNQITAGKIGSGKTFGTLLELLRAKAAYGDELVIFVLDPLRGFKPISNLLDAEEVTVGGNLGLNPMGIKKTPEKVLRETPDMDPYGENKDSLLNFFEMFFKMQDRKLGEDRDVLDIAIDITYKKAGITKDPQTHDKESPTITELRDVLETIERNPDTLDIADEGSEFISNEVQEQAARLVRSLSAFSENGQYNHLAKKTELDISDEDVVYFNLSQKEGSGETGLMMHLLLSEVYGRAKETDKNVMFCIDEARYIMKDAKSLDYLEQVVRHSRHYNLSINFITQTLEEFFSHEKSEYIAQQCSMKRIHRLESGLTENVKDTLKLNENHVNYIQQASPGSEEKGYSEALLGIDEYGYIPCRIRPSTFEIESIDRAESDV